MRRPVESFKKYCARTHSAMSMQRAQTKLCVLLQLVHATQPISCPVPKFVHNLANMTSHSR